MPLSTSIALSITAVLSKPQSVAGYVPATTLPYSQLINLASGVAAGQADKIFISNRTLAASANEDLDLAGVLTDDFGQVITFARVKGLLVAANPANVNNVVVGAAAANPWATLLNATGTATLRPGSFVLAAAGVADAIGYAVTAGAGDLLRVANSAGGSTVNYDVVIIGASA